MTSSTTRKRSRFTCWLERRVRRFLERRVDSLPAAWAKAVAWYYPYAPLRKAYLARFGVDMGEGTLANVGLIPVGGGQSRARIGCNVSIAPNVVLVLSSAANNGVSINRFKYVAERLTKDADIIVEDEAWIGANVTVLPGVTIGRCAVIGAGCVLTHDAEPFGIYAGVPGRKIGDIRQWEDDFAGSE